MKTIASTLSLLAATLLFGCSTTSPRHDYSGAATDIVVTVTCSEPSMTFTGTIVSDGHTEQLSGTGSGTFHSTGHEIVCSFKASAAEGRISISVSERGKSLGGSSTPLPAGGVRAELLRTRSEQQTMISTF